MNAPLWVLLEITCPLYPIIWPPPYGRFSAPATGASSALTELEFGHTIASSNVTIACWMVGGGPPALMTRFLPNGKVIVESMADVVSACWVKVSSDVFIVEFSSGLFPSSLLTPVSLKDLLLVYADKMVFDSSIEPPANFDVPLLSLKKPGSLLLLLLLLLPPPDSVSGSREVDLLEFSAVISNGFMSGEHIRKCLQVYGVCIRNDGSW